MDWWRVMSAVDANEFLSRFFSGPNNVWPQRDPNAAAAERIRPFLSPLETGGECPLVLPRRDQGSPAACYYVICRDRAHAGRMRPLIHAALADHWTPFDGRTARLDEADPVDSAVLDYAGPGATFVLRPTRDTAGAAYVALLRLVHLLDDIPLRRPESPRPVGRLLREFELALASGTAAASAELLAQIEAFGGISHENVAFLQIRRLARLGRDTELLSHGSIPALVYAEPPRLVREAIVGAWARTHIPRPLLAENLESAMSALGAAKPDVALLVDSHFADVADPDAATLAGLVALVRADRDLTMAVCQNDALDPSVALALSEANREGEPTGPGENSQDGDPDDRTGRAAVVEDDESDSGRVSAGSWLEWVSALGGERGVELLGDEVYSWPPAHVVDGELADSIDDLPELATDDLLLGVARFLEVDDPDRPAAATAGALLRRFLIAERFAPHDLGAICSLLEIVLRGAPSAADYKEVLGDVRESANQWLSIGAAERALDIGDTVVLGPAADSSAREDFVAALLSPLNQQKHRLSAGIRSLSAIVTSDVGLDFDWVIDNPDPVEAERRESGIAPRILLYSLDEGTLARARAAVEQTWPAAVVRVSSDKVGSPRLTQHTQNAELIVVATRRAAHSATGCIADNAGAALIRYPDGAGSASMIRAVEAGLKDLGR